MLEIYWPSSPCWFCYGTSATLAATRRARARARAVTAARRAGARRRRTRAGARGAASGHTAPGHHRAVAPPCRRAVVVAKCSLHRGRCTRRVALTVHVRARTQPAARCDMPPSSVTRATACVHRACRAARLNVALRRALALRRAPARRARCPPRCARGRRAARRTLRRAPRPCAPRPRALRPRPPRRRAVVVAQCSLHRGRYTRRVALTVHVRARTQPAARCAIPPSSVTRATACVHSACRASRLNAALRPRCAARRALRRAPALRRALRRALALRRAPACRAPRAVPTAVRARPPRRAPARATPVSAAPPRRRRCPMLVVPWSLHPPRCTNCSRARAHVARGAVCHAPVIRDTCDRVCSSRLPRVTPKRRAALRCAARRALRRAPALRRALRRALALRRAPALRRALRRALALRRAPARRAPRAVPTAVPRARARHARVRRAAAPSSLPNARCTVVVAPAALH
jgi:hypothetical protein